MSQFGITLMYLIVGAIIGAVLGAIIANNA